MKELLAGVLLVLVVGIGGFFYRNILERKPVPQAGQVACTLEARVCPSGASVGRTGSSCEFEACPAPNVEFAEAGFALVLPPGYERIQTGAPGQETLAMFTKPGNEANAPHVLTIRRYPIAEGETGEQTLLTRVRIQPADLPPESIEDFTKVTLGNSTFYRIGLERFEGQVEIAYYLVRTNDILAFSLLERDVTNWTNPNLVEDSLPEQSQLRSLLTTLAVWDR